MRRMIAILALMALALPAAANDGGWTYCFYVGFADGKVLNETGDWLADGTVYTMPYEYTGESITFEVPGIDNPTTTTWPKTADVLYDDNTLVFGGHPNPGDLFLTIERITS